MRHDPDFHRLQARAAPDRTRGWSQAGFGLALLVMAGVGTGVGLNWPAPRVAAAPGTAGASDRDGEAAHFTLCHSGGGINCVVDGDTIWFAGEKIRIADIDAPETHPPRCAEEARLGDAATLRLQALLNAGPFSLSAADRDVDRYGRKLRIVRRGGNSLGDMLVVEGLARPWTGRRMPWC